MQYVQGGVSSVTSHNTLDKATSIIADHDTTSGVFNSSNPLGTTVTCGPHGTQIPRSKYDKIAE